MDKFLSADYWNERYMKEETGWDIGFVSTPLKIYIDQLTAKDVSILIPGGGNSYEAAYLLEKGFSNITVIDIAPIVAEKLSIQFSEHGNSIQVICGDFFSLTGNYDLILEQTFFCAIDPSLRKAYAEKMQQLLNPNGKLVGLLFNRSFENNPPFGGDENEYRDLFNPYFHIQTMEPSYNSIPQRAGSELFIILQKK